MSGASNPLPTEVGLSLGSNLGERLELLRDARRRLGQIPGVEVVASSPIYETEPVGVRDEYRELAYLNAVLIVSSSCPAEELSEAVHAVEHSMGRVRGDDRNAPRTIDIDILYIGNLQFADPDLTVPHPSWTARRFVVQPLADVRPELVLPGESRSCRDVLSALPDSPRAILFDTQW